MNALLWKRLRDFFSWRRTRRLKELMRPLPLRLTVHHFDLSQVKTPEELRDVFAEHFDLPDDYRYMWGPLRHALREQERPFDGVLAIFDGWRTFAARMPRYAKRVKHVFGHGYRQSIADHGRIIAHFE